MGTSRLWYRSALAVYDRVYRFWFGLDTPESAIGPVLRIELRQSPRRLALSDDTVVRPGDLVGVVHLDNEAVAALHVQHETPMQVGLAFRRVFVASLDALAELARSGERFADVRAFTATTIFYASMRRLGFEVEPGGVRAPTLVAVYQRALLASHHPAGRLRCRGPVYLRAQRVWISRRALLSRCGAPLTKPAAAAGRPETIARRVLDRRRIQY